MRKRIKKILVKIYWFIFQNIFLLFPINEKKIVFESFIGRYYSDNPKTIYEYMIDNNYDNEYIWFFNEPFEKTIKGDAKKIKRMRIKYLYHLLTAKYIVTNSRIPLRFKKRKNQIYIQTWHGTPLKKLVYDMENVTLPGTTKETYYVNFSRDVAKWDYLISPNSYSTEIFKRAFRYEKEILEIGYPRNEILETEDKNLRDKIKEELGLYKTQKVILYAPTFRDDDFVAKGNYIQKIKIDLDKLTELYEDYVILIRTHYLVKTIESNGVDVFTNPKVINASSYEDIGELYLISDILITDYSSVFFDYSILQRPIILYQYDYEKYKDELRGFYLAQEELPVNPVYTEEELFEELEKIIKNKKFEYNSKYIDKILKTDYKNSSQKLLEKIKKENNEKK